MRIALRAYSEPSTWKPPTGVGGRRWKRPKKEHVLAFDSETTTGREQAFLFAFYRFLKLTWDKDVPTVVCLEEGIVHADDLRETRPAEYDVLFDYANAHAADVGPSHLEPGVEEPARPELRLLSRRDFVEHVLVPACVAVATTTCYNAPFDLSRIGVGYGEARGRFLRGIRIALATYATKNGTTKTRVRVRTKRLAPKRHVVEISALPTERTGKTIWGRVLDLQVLCFALSDHHYSLAGACRAFGVTKGKLRRPALGKITIPLIRYARRDVEATAELYAKVLAEYRRHPISLDPIQAFSPATIAKAYFRAMGIRPLLARQPDFDRAVLGWAMSAYYGGRVECLIRRHPVPVTVLDIRSTYPTLCILLRAFRFLTAERVLVVDATDEVRRMLEKITFADCLKRRTWTRLVGLVKIVPEGATLPIRARFSGNPQWEMGIEDVSGAEGYWWTIPDAVAAKLLDGQLPGQIERAILLRPEGTQPGLRSSRLRGEVKVDPRRGDLFKTVVQERERVRSAGDDEAERLQRFLKTFGNASGYGLHVEFRRRDLAKGKREEVTVHGRHDDPWTRKLEAPEDPGPWCFPPLAACITGGARLLLALIEKMVAERGGVHAYMDTDSIFVVSNREGRDINGIRALSWVEVDEIVECLSSLNPFDKRLVPGSIVKLEDENFDESGARREVSFFGISSKRYCLFTLGEKGELEIVKASNHGLGHLLDPTHIEAEDDEEEDAERFTKELWRWVLSKDLGLPVTDPEWLDLPAVGRVSLSTLNAMVPFAEYNRRRSYPEQIKPHGFAVACYVKEGGLPPDVEDAEHFHLVGPFEQEPAKWLRLPWFDLYSGKGYRIRTGSTSRAHGNWCVVKSYREVLEDYRTHPETKLAGADGRPCSEQTVGLLRRRSVFIAGATHIGKETNELEARLAGTIHDLDEVLQELGDPASAMEVLVRETLKQIGAPRVSELSGLDRVSVWRFLHKRATPHPKHLRIYAQIALAHARERLRERGVRPPRDEFDCLVAYLAAVVQQGPAPVTTSAACQSEV
jgi:hypothetical protein